MNNITLKVDSIVTAKNNIINFPMYIKKIFLIFSVYILLTGCGSENQNNLFNEELGQSLEIALTNATNDYNVFGAVLAVKSPNGAIWRGAVGHSVVENSTQMSTDLSFRIGSVTKTFTSTVTLMLVDRGLLTLKSTIDDIVPELNIVMGDQITIENLLEMRSGLGKYLTNELFFNFFLNDPGHVWSPEELAEFSNIDTGEPDTTFLYNNGNYIILGLIIEKLTGKSYNMVLDEYIFKPLNMHNTILATNPNLPEPFSYGYEYDASSDLVINTTYILNPLVAWSAGGMVSNVDDLLIWTEAYMTGSLISNLLHKKQFTLREAIENPVIEAYGLGVMKYKSLIGHDGFIPPYGSWIATYRDYHFVLLINGSGKGTDAVLAASLVLVDIIDSIDNKL